MSLPTTDANGSLSNEIGRIFKSVAEHLADLRAEGFDEKTPAYRELLAIYVTLATREIDRFYGRRS